MRARPGRVVHVVADAVSVDQPVRHAGVSSYRHEGDRFAARQHRIDRGGDLLAFIVAVARTGLPQHCGMYPTCGSIDQTEWFLLLHGPAFDVSTDGLEALEKSFIRECRWWSLDEIRRSTEEFVPRDLADRLDDLFTQGPPTRPVEVGR